MVRYRLGKIKLLKWVEKYQEMDEKRPPALFSEV
jgi:hypothetical protein